MHAYVRCLSFVVILLGSCFSTLWAKGNQVSGIDYSMYFYADIRDGEYCATEVKDGKVVFINDVTNPAMTCPDAFSWHLFAEAVSDRFWSRWANEEQNWPPEPYPLCDGTNAGKCCTPGKPATGDLKGHCPVFPGDQQAGLLKKLDKANSRRALSLLEDNPELNRQAFGSILEHGANIPRPALLSAESKDNACTDAEIAGLIPKDYESIGRVIRQTNSELTVRNRPFHYYLYRNNLYNADGVMDVFTRNDLNQQQNAPFHLPNHSALTNQQAGKQKLSTVDLPPDSVMIKSNWLFYKLADDLGVQSTPDAPYITKRMTTTVCKAADKNPETCGGSAPEENFCNLTGTHYLVSFHVSSKDVPQWVWTTFEHVSMPGRCDFTGCNDSFGYQSSLPPGAAEGSAHNYLEPHQRSDQLSQPSWVYNRDKVYQPEKITPELQAIFDAFDIGTGNSDSAEEPDPEDKAWLSYRLKGSQVNFTDHEGRPTLLGNSITEAGFMSQSSCISCHSRAGIHIQWQPDPTGPGPVTVKPVANFFRLGVFSRQLSDYGYQQSVHGIPNPNWFHNDDSSASLDVLQTDFVWGFLFASPLVK